MLSLSRPGLCLGAVVAAYIAYALVLLPIGVDDIRMADVFSVDEAGAAVEIRYAFSSGRLDRPSFTYGSLFYFFPLAALHVASAFVTVTDRVILLVLRATCLGAGAGCLFLTYRVGRAVFDAWAALLACLLLATTAPFLRWSVESHPDLLQVFWMLACLGCCARLAGGFTWRRFVLAGVFAAAAFNSKYGGGFLLPVIVLSVFLSAQDGGGAQTAWRRLKDRRRLLAAALVPAVFAAAFALTNPYAVLQFDAFVERLGAEKAIMDFGHTFAVEGGGFQWLTSLAGLSGLVNVAAMALAAGLWARGDRRIAPGVVVLVAWVAVYTGTLVFGVNVTASRHLLPVLPAVALLSGGAARALQRAAGGFPGRLALLAAAPAVLVCGVAAARVPWAHDFAAERRGRVDGSDEIRAGRWIAGHYSPETRIVYDAYGYVPGGYQNAFRTFGMTYAMIAHYEPDLLVVRRAIAADYADRSRARDARVGEREYLDHHYFYRYLAEGRFPEYTPAAAFGGVTVYARRDSAAVRRAPWMDLAREWVAGRPRNLTEGFRRMAALHASAGETAAAERDLARAEGARSRALAGYEQALGHLSRGDLHEARHAYERVFEATRDSPDSVRAAMHLAAARGFFEAGSYDDAVREGRRALEVFPDLREAAFDLGLFLLAGGTESAADSAFGAAVARYGPDARARSILEQAVRQGVGAAAGTRIRERYFGGKEAGRGGP